MIPAHLIFGADRRLQKLGDRSAQCAQRTEAEPADLRKGAGRPEEVESPYSFDALSFFTVVHLFGADQS